MCKAGGIRLVTISDYMDEPFKNTEDQMRQLLIHQLISQ